MKEENKKYLEKFRDDLVTALFYDYSRQIPRQDLIEFERIEYEESGKVQNNNLTCSYCVLRLIKRLAKIYFKDYPDEVPDNQKDKKI